MNMSAKTELPPYCAEQEGELGDLAEFAEAKGQYDLALQVLKEHNPGLVSQIDAMIGGLYDKHGQAFEDSHVRVLGRSLDTRRKVCLWWRPQVSEGNHFGVGVHSDIARPVGTNAMEMDVYMGEGGPEAIMQTGGPCDHPLYRQTLVDLADKADNLKLNYQSER